MRIPSVRVLFLLGSALAPCAAQGADKSPPAGDATFARYKELRARLPFVHHTEARKLLAGTRSGQALAALAQDYATVKDFPEFARYTLAALFGEYFDKAEFVEPLTQLRNANQRPADTWLWVHALRIQIDRSGDAEALAIVRDGKNVLQRAAAITAIGLSRAGDLRAAILPTCATFPKKESDRMVLLGAMTGALDENKRRVNAADYREALTAYIGLLGNDVGLTHTAKVQIARHLQLILKGPTAYMTPEPWLELMQRGEVKSSGPAHTVTTQRFFGLETEGERICYVVDMSDSMCKAIDPSSKPRQSGPVTGQKPVKKKRELLDENDLPWDKILTRWDLAREQLRLSLLRLPPEKHFSIVWFGTQSGTLDSCRGMTKATRQNVEKVLAELESIQMVPPSKLQGQDLAIAPDGKLRGNTNLHSGMRRAFSLAGRGFVEAAAYVDPEALTEGCDTIFLLSDGAPSLDDFTVEDKDYGEGQQVLDTEYNRSVARQPRTNYTGPYMLDEWLLADLRRMNAFRRIRIHCVGLGEANSQLLDAIAKIGHGEMLIFGAKK